jgi:soluble lytic murein transglycosylase-like protein
MKIDSKIYLTKFNGILSLRVAIAVSIVFIITAAIVAHADIYKYVDKEGVLHLTNTPTDHNAKYVMILREKRILFQPNIDVNKYDDLITKAANKFKLDSALIKAVIKAESNFNHRAVSPVGAQGLMQLMPKTASDLKVEDSFHPEKNIEGGARYLRYLLNTYKGDLTLALAAYNAGEKAVAKYNYNVPPYRETQNYVKRVYSFYDSYRSTNTR